MEEVLIRAIIAGFIMSFVVGPLGCFVVWRKMSYFGETLAHCSLLGVALGFLLQINLYFSIVGVCLVVAYVLSRMVVAKSTSIDASLGVIAHTALALGLIALVFVQDPRLNIMNYLFGDILAISWAEIQIMAAGAAVVLLVMFTVWNKLIALTVHEDMASVDGISVQGYQLVLFVLMALVIALSIQLVGVLLVTALLIIPAAAANRISKSPEQMARISVLFSILAVLCGISCSLWWDIPTGPAIVVMASAIFCLTRFKKLRR